MKCRKTENNSSITASPTNRWTLMVESSSQKRSYKELSIQAAGTTITSPLPERTTAKRKELEINLSSNFWFIIFDWSFLLIIIFFFYFFYGHALFAFLMCLYINTNTYFLMSEYDDVKYMFILFHIFFLKFQFDWSSRKMGVWVGNELGGTKGKKEIRWRFKCWEWLL